jgi:hypothetical protein
MLFTLGPCLCCSKMARLERDLCASCVSEYGERMAVLIGRARTHAGFAEACASRMSPDARDSFNQVLEDRRVRPHGAPRKTTGRPAPSRTTGPVHLHSVGGRKRS